MLTPQDIQEKEFGKAVFGGYDMSEVDDFLEELGNDYQTLYKENAVLKGKLKVLVDKVEEYRSTEDAMRMAIMTAQKMSDDMMEETQKKCDEMVREAEEKAGAAYKDITQKADMEEERLKNARSETAKFISLSRELIANQAEFLRKVSEVTGEALPEDEEIDEPVFSPEAGSVRHETKPAPEPVKKAEPGVKAAPAPVPEKTEEEKKEERDSFLNDIMETPAVKENLEETRRVPELPIQEVKQERIWTEEDEATTPRPKFKFDDLQFGENYNKDSK